MLCANCHRLVDKSPESYPLLVLRRWKDERAEKAELSLGLRCFETRVAARGAIQPLLIQNWEIFERLGPQNDYSANPEAEEATAWKLAMQETVIPNHLQVLCIVEANRHLLTVEEEQLLARYRSHVHDLSARHIEKLEGRISRRYPIEMDSIFG